ncbi:ubiquitin-like small modifier protein 1 [Candidatus Aciduliprofundum boonei]|uniref:MoaD family protein n=1 Tax=Aciduliprofundum boonei (strain DSM 19572 / T469) TaxID=439481 RepID=D3TB68_ACIB4|nr:ubiquitin-like small modifier protein 1 [Candidatus Aciduliprofundum boonei]ADD09347.1 MoaD family protein [Aciduliprofundum boonei T469]HII54467.1 MoaD/ThiS family protein [Candidatus Aciduliprofundum boonei]
MPKVKFFATLREITGKREEIIEGDNVGDVLKVLYEEYGEEFEKELKERSMILVNGKNIEHLEGLKTKVSEEDTISIFPPAGGG